MKDFIAFIVLVSLMVFAINRMEYVEKEAERHFIKTDVYACFSCHSVLTRADTPLTVITDREIYDLVDEIARR